MGTSASNSLDLSVSDPSGYEYRVKFQAESFAEGKHRKCYIATLSNEKAPKHNKKVVLKVFKPEYVNKYDFDYECVKDLERSITCHELSIQFNKTMEEFQSSGYSLPISFPAPLRINIKRGKDIQNNINLTNKLISKVFNNIPIKLKNHKYLTVQSYLNKNSTEYKYIKMSSNNGWFNTDSDAKSYEFLAAFSHFSWVNTKGKMLINGFQGMRRNGVFFLNDAILHSNIGNNGNNDLGIIGIINFFLNHKCNDCCRNLPVLNTTLLMDYLNKDSIFKIDKSTSYLYELNKTDLVTDENGMKSVYEQSINDAFNEHPIIKSEAGVIENETIDKMEQIESIITDNNNPDDRISEFAENETNIQKSVVNIHMNEESTTVNVIEEEQYEMDVFVEREDEYENDSVYSGNESSSSISDIDDFENESLIQQIQHEENMKMEMEINNNNNDVIDVSWFGDDDALNESYHEQKELYDLDANNNSAIDEWEVIN